VDHVYDETGISFKPGAKFFSALVALDGLREKIERRADSFFVSVCVGIPESCIALIRLQAFKCGPTPFRTLAVVHLRFGVRCYT
jgi:hypothetical protein